MRKAIWTAAAGLVALLPGAGVLWGSATVLAAGEVVSMRDDDPNAQKWGFEPAAITVAAGTEVTFRNDGAQPHNVTANDKSFDSPMLSKGEEWKFTFANAGDFAYFCKPHPWMKGTIKVTGAAAPAPPPATAAPAPAQPAPPPATAAPAPAPAPPKQAAQTAPGAATTTTAPTTPTTAAATTETTAAAPAAPQSEAPAADAATATETPSVENTSEPAAEGGAEGATEEHGEEHGEGAMATLSDEKETSGLAVGVAIGGALILLATAVLSIPARKRPSPLT